MTAGTPKLFVGQRVRRLREAAGIGQAALSRAIGFSASYLNQIERDQRPLSGAVLHRLCEVLEVGPGYFGEDEALRQAQDLREAMADPLFGPLAASPAEARRVVEAVPEVVRRFLTLYRAYLNQGEQIRGLRGRSDVDGSGSLGAYEEVRDWVQSRRNHFDALDRAAEAMSAGPGFIGAALWEALIGRLRERHGLAVVSDPSLLQQGTMWRLQHRQGRLLLAEAATRESRVFWMCHVLALLEQRRLIDREVATARLSTDEARSLARVGLANYYAGALMMPYRPFLQAAEAVRYDVERLQARFGASFEQVCHRLSTMQRPGLAGIPFYFVKTDIAGNVLKRSSATRFQFARFGGPCSLWNVYRAFATPGQVLVQLARTPDGVCYLNVARTVSRDGGFYLARPRAVAVVLGCEMENAGRTVYAAGLDLRDQDSAVPIGPGCRVCDRTGCRHRAVPPVGQALDIGTEERGVVPYRIHAWKPPASK